MNIIKQGFNKLNNFYIAIILLGIILLIHINILLAPIGTYFSSFDDIDLHYYINIRQYVFYSIKSVVFPLWTTKIFCGIPFFANSETAVFYLPNIIFFILPISKAINFSFILHFFILAFSIFLWINNKIKNKFIAILIAIISIFSSNYYLHFYAAHLSNIITVSWFPLLLYFYDKTFEKKKFTNIFPITFIISLQIFAGHFQYIYYTALVSLIYILLFCRNKYVFITLASSYCFAFFLTAIQILPSYDFYLEGGRIANIFDTANISINSKLQYLITLLLSINIPFTSTMFWETSNYIGTFNFFIILLTLFHIQNKNILKNTLIVVILYLLTFKLFSNLAINIIPCFSWFRSPIKLLFFANVLLLPILAYGIKYIILKQSKTNLFFIVLIITISLFTLFLRKEILNLMIYDNIIKNETINTIKLFITICPILFLFFTILLCLKKYLIFRTIILILLVCEPIIVMKLYSKPLIYKNDYKYEYILKEEFNKQPRFFSYNKYCLKYKAENILGIYPDKLKNYLLFNADKDNDNILGLLRCKYIIDDYSNSIKRTNNKTLNRVNIFYDYKTEKDKDKIYDILSDKNFNIFDTVVLEDTPKYKTVIKGNYNLKILHFNENSLDFECNTSEPAIILYTDNYARGWKAYEIDNPKQKYEIICADYLYKAISVDKGYHKIRFEYKPLSFVIGVWISIFSWIIFVFFWIFTTHIKKKNKVFNKQH